MSVGSSFFPPIALRSFTALSFFNTNMDDSDNEWQVIHCVSFVNGFFFMEKKLVFHAVCLAFEVLFTKILDFFNI